MNWIEMDDRTAYWPDSATKVAVSSSDETSKKDLEDIASSLHHHLGGAWAWTGSCEVTENGGELLWFKKVGDA